MKKIKLTQGKYALVDDKDFEWLNQWKWCIHHKRYYSQYASTRINGKTVYMHRAILGLCKGDGIYADHINGNGLDNRRRNLRKCTRQQNHRNQICKSKTQTSKYKGVSWCRYRSKWRVRIKLNSKRISLGRFVDERKAAEAYDRRARKEFGDFARPNFPEQT